ncbi:rCG37105 [Rattus norvegicus]|uniref:RCG37105 n=1 Tax=Rattus norvegicus TaxID=10116 RepID=A6HTV2_RAT|nr:rCG37105 [Rattus norvegicus]
MLEYEGLFEGLWERKACEDEDSCKNANSLWKQFLVRAKHHKAPRQESQISDVSRLLRGKVLSVVPLHSLPGVVWTLTNTSKPATLASPRVKEVVLLFYRCEETPWSQQLL